MKQYVTQFLAALLCAALLVCAAPSAFAADEGPVSRAIALQMLYNHAGRPAIETGTESPFSDVKAESP